MTVSNPTKRTQRSDVTLSNEASFVSEIRKFAKQHCPPQDSELGIGDDAAVLPWPRDFPLVMSVDDHCQGVHFEHRWCPPQSIGRRAAGSALSDLAAMGAKARGAMLSLQCPPDLTPALFRGVLEGFTKTLGQYSAVLYGGNLTQSPLLNLSVSVFGELARSRPWTRDSARPGDDVWVSGALGASHLALLSLDRGLHGGRFEAVQARYLSPRPRFDLVDSCIPDHAAAMDISDGLARDAGRMARASEVTFVLNRESLIQESFRALAQTLNQDPLELAYKSGEEYELLFAVPRSERDALSELGLIRIGEVVSWSPGQAHLQDDQGQNIEESLGFDHFKEPS